MNSAFAFVGLETLNILYERGFITAEALTAIAPLKWLAKHYPELLNQPEKAMTAIASIQDFTKPLNIRSTRHKTCGECIHFSSVHGMCNTRIDNQDTYLAVTRQSPSCPDFDTVELPPFINKRGMP